MTSVTQHSNISVTSSIPDASIYGPDPIPLSCRIVTREFAYIPWNNPRNLITLETAYLVAKLMDGIVSPLMSFFGLPLNIVNCLVFYKQGLRDRINLLLFCQGGADFLVEVTVLFHSIEYFLTFLGGNFQAYGPWTRFKHNNGLNILYGFVYVSAFISVMIACERCLCITFPLKAKKFFKSSTSAGFIIAATVILMGLHFFISDKYRVGCIHYTQLNLTVTGFIPSPFYIQHQKFVDILNAVLYGFGLPCVFIMTTIVTTAITTVKLKTAAAWRQQTSSASQDHHRSEVAITKMLIAVSCLFVACTIPSIVAKLMPLVVPDFSLGGRFQNLFMACVGLLHVTPAVNCGLNFFFYFWLGSKFRVTLKLLCCGPIRKPIGQSTGVKM
ncbi:hypothetical protein ACOMHN_003108 [Nucella lapillus]